MTKKKTTKKTASKKPVKQEAKEQSKIGSTKIEAKSGKDIGKVFHICELTCPDKTTKFRKRFRPDHLATHAVVSTVKGSGEFHVYRWSSNERNCNNLVKQINKMYIEKKKRYTDAVVVKVRDLGIPEGPIDPKYLQDRTWLRVLRAREKADSLMKAGASTAAIIGVLSTIAPYVC